MGKITIKERKSKTEKVRIGAAAHEPEETPSWLDDPRLLMATARRLEREHANRVNENRGYQRLYYAKPHMTQTMVDDAGVVRMFDQLRRNGNNLTAEVIDAIVALIARQLQPKALPVGGDNETFQACKRVSRVLDGLSEANDVLDEFTEVLRQGLICDSGFALVDIDKATDEIKTWQLDQHYVFWPDDATRYPGTLVIVMPIPKRKLMAQYQTHADKIRKLPVWRPKRVVGVDSTSTAKQDVETVAVAIGWGLALGPKAPGRRVVSAGDDLVLEEDDYKLDIHQVIKFSWKRNATGFSGVPAARAAAPYDLTNKRLLSRTLSALDGAVPWLLAEEENDIQAISDVDFQKVTYPRGSQPPQVIVPNPVSTQALDRIEANRASTFRELHVNESASQGQAPPGFKSAVAQFAWADSVQTVLLPVQNSWQRLWRMWGHVSVALMGNRKVQARLGDMLEEVTLPDLPRDKYKISFGIQSGLSLTVSGRLEQLEQIQARLPNKLDNEDVLRMIGLPDTQQLADRVLSPRELAEWIVQRALNDGHVEAPPRMLGKDGLAALYRIAAQEYCGAVKKPRNYYKRTHVEALRRVVLICGKMINDPALMPPEPMPEPAPPAEPLPGGPIVPLGGAPPGAPPPPPAAPPAM